MAAIPRPAGRPPAPPAPQRHVELGQLARSRPGLGTQFAKPAGEDVNVHVPAVDPAAVLGEFVPSVHDDRRAHSH
ncbi:hypothetical protein [Streptomyces sp. NBC_00286]|uniref:hypothetical protein n=1 Tax=Streptomyces sp. NBC_00286 TaxID=2975701 RepID=UPI002E2E5688|nr:hypothetical protein [Streptomyces sp. NBC_00286]